MKNTAALSPRTHAVPELNRFLLLFVFGAQPDSDSRNHSVIPAVWLHVPGRFCWNGYMNMAFCVCAEREKKEKKSFSTTGYTPFGCRWKRLIRFGTFLLNCIEFFTSVNNAFIFKLHDLTA